MTLTLIAGLPGAGKSTRAAAMARVTGAHVVTFDAIRIARMPAGEVFARGRAAVVRELAAGRSVVVDACALRREDRDPWLTLARLHGARAEIVWLRVARGVG